MTTRSVIGTLRHTNGTPWAAASIKFTLTAGSYVGNDLYPPDSVTVTTGQDGTFSATLWANGEGAHATKYECALPNGDSFRFSLPADPADPVALTVLRATAQPQPVPLSTLLQLLDDRYAPVGSVGGTGDLHYRHVQMTATAVWTITHNLGKRPAVTTTDSSGREVYGVVEYLSDNQVRVTFSAAFSGEALCN